MHFPSIMLLSWGPLIRPRVINQSSPTPTGWKVRRESATFQAEHQGVAKGGLVTGGLAKGLNTQR